MLESFLHLRKFSGHCSYVAVLNEKIRPHHEAHEGHEGFRIFQTPNFVIFVSFVVNIFLPIWLRLCRAGSFVVKFSYGKIAATTSSRLRCTCASSVMPQVTAT